MEPRSSHASREPDVRQETKLDQVKGALDAHVSYADAILGRAARLVDKLDGSAAPTAASQKPSAVPSGLMGEIREQQDILGATLDKIDSRLRRLEDIL